MNAGCFFLVTRKATHYAHNLMDTLEIEGLFCTEKDADERIKQCKERDERIKSDPLVENWDKYYIYTYTVTEMYPNMPFKDDEYKQYPSAWYEE